jgi:phage gp29-like protein
MGIIRKVLDVFGRPIEATPDRTDLTTRTLIATQQDRLSIGSVLGNVTPANILSVFNEADNGYPGRQIELAEDIRERDDHVTSMDQTRRLAVCGLEWFGEPGDDTPQAKLALDAWKEHWEALEPNTIFERLLGAVLDQWHVERVIWDTDGKLAGRTMWRPVAVEEVDARRLCWPTMPPGSIDGSDISWIVPQLQRSWTASDTEPLSPGKYLWHSYRAKRGRPGRGALIRCIAVYWMFKRFSLTDMATLLEQWGRPWPAVTYGDNATPDQVTAWLNRLVKSMANRVLALPSAAKLEVIDAKAAGADTPHMNMIRACNEAISKVLVGSTTIAEAAANNDSVSSPTHADVREDVRNADALALSASLRANLIVPWTVWNFGPDVAPPRWRPNLQPKPNPTSRAAVYINARDLGLQVYSDQLYSELGLERPEGVEDVLALTPPAAAGLLGMSMPAVDSPVPVVPSETPIEPAAQPVAQQAEVLPELVLNGAQIQAAIAIVKSVAMGEMPRDAGIGQLQVLFNLKSEQAESIMGSAGSGSWMPRSVEPDPLRNSA